MLLIFCQTFDTLVQNFRQLWQSKFPQISATTEKANWKDRNITAGLLGRSILLTQNQLPNRKHDESVYLLWGAS